MTFAFATLTTTAVVVYKIIPASFVVMRAIHGSLQFLSVSIGST